MWIVVSASSNHHLAWIRMPTADTVASFQQAIADKYPSLPDVWGTYDGVKFEFSVN
jgi:hypothetical protein